MRGKQSEHWYTSLNVFAVYAELMIALFSFNDFCFGFKFIYIYIYIHSFIRVSRLHPLSFMPKSASGLVNLQLLSVIRLPYWAGTLKMGAHCTSITNRRLSKTRGWCFKKRNVTLSPLFFSSFLSSDVYQNESHSHRSLTIKLKIDHLSTVWLPMDS